MAAEPMRPARGSGITGEPPGPLARRLGLAGHCRICGSATTPPATVCAVCWLIRRYPERVPPDRDGLG
jgi:hypothetical protein